MYYIQFACGTITNAILRFHNGNFLYVLFARKLPTPPFFMLRSSHMPYTNEIFDEELVIISDRWLRQTTRMIARVRGWGEKRTSMGNAFGFLPK